MFSLHRIASHVCRSKTSLKQILLNSSTRFRQVGVFAKPGHVDPITYGVSMEGRKAVSRWLFACAGMTFGAVVLGGVTRLTESGLSMVDWHLVKERPPLSASEWEKEFEKYKQFPEYQHILNEKGGMSINEFKFIWTMEYSHRMWGRATGLVIFLPWVYFLKKGYLNPVMKPRAIGFQLLVLSQGLLGWFMVKSGLEKRKTRTGVDEIPRVSQYRLAAHLGTAFTLYTALFWHALSFINQPKNLEHVPKIGMIRNLSRTVTGLVFVTAFSGAFVAGLDAGLVYNSWPKMADRWLPSDYLALDPKWANIFENPAAVQFDHRWLGQTTGAAIAALWLLTRRSPLPPNARLAVNAVAGMAVIQITLGVTTLLTYVPIPVAASHQSGSLILLSLALWFQNVIRALPK